MKPVAPVTAIRIRHSGANGGALGANAASRPPRTRAEVPPARPAWERVARWAGRRGMNAPAPFPTTKARARGRQVLPHSRHARSVRGRAAKPTRERAPATLGILRRDHHELGRVLRQFREAVLPVPLHRSPVHDDRSPPGRSESSTPAILGSPIAPYAARTLSTSAACSTIVRTRIPAPPAPRSRAVLRGRPRARSPTSPRTSPPADRAAHRDRASLRDPLEKRIHPRHVRATRASVFGSRSRFV